MTGRIVLCQFYDKTLVIVDPLKESRPKLNAPMAYKDFSPWNTAQVY